VAFSPDGARLLTGSRDHTAKLWDAATGDCIRTFAGHTDGVYSVAFSPDGTQVLTGSSDSTAKLWDAASGECIRTFQAHAGSVTSVAFSPDGNRVLAGTAEGMVYVSATTGAECITAYRNEGDVVSCVAFSPDGGRFAAGFKQWSADVWDASSGEPIQHISHRGGVGSLAFSPDGAKLATGGSDPLARVWDVATGKGLISLGGHYIWSELDLNQARCSIERFRRRFSPIRDASEAASGRRFLKIRAHSFLASEIRLIFRGRGSRRSGFSFSGRTFPVLLPCSMAACYASRRRRMTSKVSKKVSTHSLYPRIR